MKYTVQKANQFFKGDKPIPVGGDIDLEDNVLTRKFVERGHVEAPASGGTVSGKQEYRQTLTRCPAISRTSTS